MGATTPGPAIFGHVPDVLDVAPTATVMVGDSWQEDAGAAALGIRTLILPPTTGPRHELEDILALVNR